VSGILGFEFYLGREVPPDKPIDKTLPPHEVSTRRSQWMRKIDGAVRDNDAWGVLVTRPNGDVVLHDVSKQRLYDATANAFTAHLLLAKESQS
jgi:hypothetical protein